MDQYEIDVEDLQAEGWKIVSKESLFLTSSNGWMEGKIDKYIDDDTGGYPSDLVAEYHIFSMQRGDEYMRLCRPGLRPKGERAAEKAIKKFGPPPV